MVDGAISTLTAAVSGVLVEVRVGRRAGGERRSNGRGMCRGEVLEGVSQALAQERPYAVLSPRDDR
jgi:hypothetical protein